MRELPLLILLALGLALVLKAFVVQAFFIPSESMEQTLHGCQGCQGDRVLVNTLVYDVRDIRRGEIVVFDGAGSFGVNREVTPTPSGNVLQRWARAAGRAVGAAPSGETDFVKRVIGLPGDRVACCVNGHVTAQPVGAARATELVEPYVFEDDAEPFCAAGLGAQLCPAGAVGVLVPPGRLWVMGDHRSRSADSRAHLGDAHQGTVPQDKVIGRVFVSVWPLDRWRLHRAPPLFG